jgi:hypothetical protein
MANGEHEKLFHVEFVNGWKFLLTKKCFSAVFFAARDADVRLALTFERRDGKNRRTLRIAVG